MKILVYLVACVTLAFLIENVFAKDCYAHTEKEGGFKLDEDADNGLLKKCTAQENSACIIVNATKTVTDADGNKKTIAVSVRDCETSKDVNCAKYKTEYTDKADYAFIACHKCNPNKCNLAWPSDSGGARAVVPGLLLAIPFALIFTKNFVY